MSRIHPTAVVDAGAVLGDGVEIGPWCVVGPGVSLAEDVRLVSHVVVQQDTSVDARTIIHPFCVIGGDPQHGGYKGEPVRLEIGSAYTLVFFLLILPLLLALQAFAKPRTPKFVAEEAE